MHRLKLGVAALIVLLALIFTVQNTQVVELRFLFWRLEMSRALLLLGVFVSGLFAGALFSGVRRISRA